MNEIEKIITLDLFGYLFLKTLLRTVFQNIKNTIFVFSENYFYYLNLVFFFISVIQGKKTVNKTCFSYYLCFFRTKLVFNNKKQSLFMSLYFL